MGLDFDIIDGQTPLEDDEKEGLLISTISTRGELDEFEQQNIEKAILWSMKRKLNHQVILTESFVKEVHKRMYGDVWSWSGEFRKTDKNIGIDKWQISTSLRTLLQDAQYWIENQTYQPDEIALRFKHRIVSIHCFSNGNGRHSRLMADIIIDKIFNQPFYTWGAANLIKAGEARTAYLRAIKAADKGDLEPLIKFARS